MLFARRAEAAQRNHGFTLLELVTIMILIGILAVFAMPRFLDRQFFNSRGFYDQSVAVLRYAQKIAIAQRRNVCVNFTVNSIGLSIANAAGNGVACTVDIAGPNGTAPYTVTAPPGVTFTGTDATPTVPTNFRYTGLGQATQGQTFRVSGMTQDIVVEQETGYVHP